MSSTSPSPVQGVQASNQIALLWERYRSLAYVVLVAVLVAMGVNYFLQYSHRRQVDAEWSKFSVSLGLEKVYDSKDAIFDMADALSAGAGGSLGSVDLTKLEQCLAAATDGQKPYLLFAIARKAVFLGQWARAESALTELEKAYPNHTLVKVSDYPVQARNQVKRVDDKPLPAGKSPELKPAVKGSAVQLLKEQIVQGQAFLPPAQFAKPTIPADAVKVKLETTLGPIVIALMPQSPIHRDAFLKLVDQQPPFWERIAVDEIRRSAKGAKQPMELHLGFESTKEEDRSKWITTEPSKNIVVFEDNGLGHFAGAVAGRLEADGKSCVDRFWISAEDNAKEDGDRVVFGYVVEGLDVVKKICELPMTAQEEDRGQGRPLDAVRISKVSRL